MNSKKSSKPAQTAQPVRKQKRSTGAGRQSAENEKTTGRDRRGNGSTGRADVYRPKYNEGSDRKHLTGREVEQLIEANRGSRHEARDRCLLLLMFRHGFRVSEACGLKLDQVDTESRLLHVARLKRGLSTTQPFRGDDPANQNKDLNRAAVARVEKICVHLYRQTGPPCCASIALWRCRPSPQDLVH
jgi:integrase